VCQFVFNPGNRPRGGAFEVIIGKLEKIGIPLKIEALGWAATGKRQSMTVWLSFSGLFLDTLHHRESHSFLRLFLDVMDLEEHRVD
jgi:hypothetical protein